MHTETSPCRYGTMTYLPHDRYIGRSMQVYGEYSELEMALMRLLLRPGDIAVDVGANIGAFTVGMARSVGVLGMVHAFEPQGAIHELLSTNVAQNGLKHVAVHRQAVGAAAGSIRVPPRDYDSVGNFGGLALGGETGDAVAVVPIDSLRLPRMWLLKVDVEGMEIDVLRGADETIRRCEPALYVENDRSHQSEALIAHIFAIGYRLWWHLTPLFNPENFRRHPEDVFGNVWSCNMIGLPANAGISLPLAEVRTAQDVARMPDGQVFEVASQ